MKINGMTVLNKDTTKCPRCKQALYFKMLSTLRLKEDIGGKLYYEAKCENDRIYFLVKAPKD